MVKQKGIRFNSPPPHFFLVVTGSNSLTVVVRELDATKRRGFINLHFDEAVVTNSLFKAIAMAQTEYSTAGGNPDGH